MYFTIRYTFDDLTWPYAGTVPEWVRAAVCFVWHSQAPFFSIYPLSVFNNVLLAGERLVAIMFPFRAAQMARTRYRVAILLGTFNINIDKFI